MQNTTTNDVGAQPTIVNSAEQTRDPAIANHHVQKWSEVTNKPWKFPKKSTGGGNVHIWSPYTFLHITPQVPAPKVHIPAPIHGQKRGPTDVIDLTGEDDEESSDEILSPRKKSRSSSSSSHRSTKLPASPAADERGVQKQASYKSTHTEKQSSYYNPFGKYSRPASFDHRPAPTTGAPKVVLNPSHLPPPPTPEEIDQRRRFLVRLAKVPNIDFRNDVDNSTPPEGFCFVAENVLREGVTRADDDFMIGCSCRKRRGVLGCKYSNECECLQDSGPPGKKRHAYHAPDERREGRGGCLVKEFLGTRYHIFECNSKCDCTLTCKNRVVQFGRKIKLELFKTKDRGFGLRTMDPLKAGQFVDTYRGEIVTRAEAERRSAGRHPDEEIYLFGLDKFTDNTTNGGDAGTSQHSQSHSQSQSQGQHQQQQQQQGQPRYVCDGRNLGGPTRFMNHSCAPNCRLFTVSYNHADTDLYELAFFAKEDVPAGTELTFDYLDLEDEDEDVVFTDDMARKHEVEHGYMPSRCRCGSAKCRGYFFFLT